MQGSEAFSKRLFYFSSHLTAPAVGVIFLLSFIISSQTEVLKLPKPAFTVLVLFILFLGICKASYILSNLILDKKKLFYPTVKLWLYPSIGFLFIILSSSSILTLSSKILGRGFWSGFLGLTSQNTTSLFSASFFSMTAYISLQFFISMAYSIKYIFDVSRSHFRLLFEEVAEEEEDPKSKIDKMLNEIQFENDHFQELRKKASIVNRKALLLFFILSTSIGIYILFFKPELILFYRAEIQLKTYSQPESALKTFDHLLIRYPNYKFADTVSFRRNWILDRRLKKYNEASKGYINFINRFGFSNVWSDEVTAGLARIYIDKLGDLESGKKWAEIYLKNYPEGVMAPHMYLYLIRVLQKQKKSAECKKLEKEALRKFGGKEIQIINIEDKLIEFVLFNDALKTNNYISKFQ